MTLDSAAVLNLYAELEEFVLRHHACGTLTADAASRASADTCFGSSAPAGSASRGTLCRMMPVRAGLDAADHDVRLIGDFPRSRRVVLTNGRSAECP